MRIILVIALALAAGPCWAYCNPATPQSYWAFMDCLDTEQEGRSALDAYREESNRRFERLEREQRYREMLEQQAQRERELQELERRRDEAMQRELRAMELEAEQRYRVLCPDCR